MQVECGLKLSCMHRIKHKHTSYSKQYLVVAMCHINQHNCNNMKIQEITKTPTPQQQRIKSLQLQKDNVNKALKAERDRQKIAKARQTIANVTLG